MLYARLHFGCMKGGKLENKVFITTGRYTDSLYSRSASVIPSTGSDSGPMPMAVKAASLTEYEVDGLRPVSVMLVKSGWVTFCRTGVLPVQGRRKIHDEFLFLFSSALTTSIEI